MNDLLKEKLSAGLAAQKGHVGMYYKNLATGETFGCRAEEPYLAASVIKLPILLCIEKWAAEGRADLEEMITVTDAQKEPICGALPLFTGDVTTDVRSLCRLMISLSDNTATNVLIDRFGIPAYEEEFRRIGLTGTRLNRRLFEPELSAQGIENYIVPAEMGALLEQVYRGIFVNPEVSREILDMLLLQQINHKIPGRIDGRADVAHKTGEDEDLSNDVGIVFAPQPFLACFAGYDTCVPDWEDFIRRASFDLYLECGGEE